MKRNLLLLTFLCVGFSMFSQTTVKIWDFENGELSGWQLGNDGDSVKISTDFAFSGTNSISLSANSTSANSELINDEYDDIRTGDIITLMLYVPASSIADINGIQLFWQDEGDAWAWNSNWFNGSDMIADSWNVLTYELPEVIPALNRIGLQIVGHSAEATPVVYVDDISIQRTVKPGDNAGFWSFENGSLGDWGKGVDGDTVFVTDERASDGLLSVKVVSANNHTNVEFQNDEFLDLVSGDTIRFDVYVTAEDQALVNGLQIFWQDEGDSWAWNSDWRNGSDLVVDSWNTLSFVYPEVIAPLDRIGFQMVGKAAEDTPALFFDNIQVIRAGDDEEVEVVIREVVGFWGFEELTLGDWAKGGDGDTLHVSDEQASEGLFSAKLVSADNHVNIEFQNDIFDNVETGDTIQMDIFATAADSALINGLQIFWQDNGESWSWNAEWIGANKLDGDAWVTLTFKYPEVIAPLNRIGLQMVSKNAADTPTIYIDNIKIIGTPRAPITPGTPVILESEEAGLGQDYAIAEDDDETYVYPLSNFTETTADFPGSSARIQEYTAYFPAAGVFDLYARVYVGTDATEDDSFLAPAGMGQMDTLDAAAWHVANNLQGIGFTVAEDTISGAGIAEIEVYKWINISELIGVTYEILDPGAAHTFQIGAREDGLRFDKIAFGNSFYKYTVANLDDGTDGAKEQIIDPGASISFESEEAVSGTGISAGTEGDLGFTSAIAENGSATNPGSADNISSYSVKMNFPGNYSLYARVNVGAGGEADDSFYAATSFGEKDASADGDWSIIDNIAQTGYMGAGDTVDGAGEAGTESYKWVNISALTGITYDIDDASVIQTFQIGTKDDGLKFDKIAFGSSSYTYFVYQLDNDLVGNLSSGVEDNIIVELEKFNKIAPNPFSVESRIDFNLQNSQDVRIEVYNAVGAKVEVLVNQRMNAGDHSVYWRPGNALNSGLYYIILNSENKRIVGKAFYVK